MRSCYTLTMPDGRSIAIVDLSKVRVLVAKSRGHYRAAFAEFTSTDRMIDVDCPGLTTPNLKQLPWTRMPRPIFPIDDDVSWPASAFAT